MKTCHELRGKKIKQDVCAFLVQVFWANKIPVPTRAAQKKKTITKNK